MDSSKAAKIAAARQKLKNHQEKRQTTERQSDNASNGNHQNNNSSIVDNFTDEPVLTLQPGHLNNEPNEKISDLEEKLQLMLTSMIAKNCENEALKSQLEQLQIQYNANLLQLQQITNGLETNDVYNTDKHASRINSLVDGDEINKLKTQIRECENEKKQLNEHYRHHMTQLEKSMKELAETNDYLNKENKKWQIREQDLIEQISEMENQLQNLYSRQIKANNSNEILLLNEKYESLEVLLNQKNSEVLAMQKELKSKDEEIRILNENILSFESTSIDRTKLLAANESDKVAAQKATSQNNKLKLDLQELQDAFVKMSKEKLDLVEKVQAEKFLNRELTIKLSELQEKLNENLSKLSAKDEEMMRLLAQCSKLEAVIEETPNICNPYNLLKNNQTGCSHLHNVDGTHQDETHGAMLSLENGIEATEEIMPTAEAMIKLQERFMKIMKDVADLSDEKQNLEHIIFQLQSETETIGEYVALYQQQRGILKQKDMERDYQIKFLSRECEQLKQQLSKLTQVADSIQESEKKAEIKNIITKMEENNLIENRLQNLEKFHPCQWCSGKLINV